MEYLENFQRIFSKVITNFKVTFQISRLFTKPIKKNQAKKNFVQQNVGEKSLAKKYFWAQSCGRTDRQTD